MTEPSQKPRVGFVGVGVMGEDAAARLVWVDAGEQRDSCRASESD